MPTIEANQIIAQTHHLLLANLMSDEVRASKEDQEMEDGL